MQLFKSHDEALTCALRFSGQQYAQSPMSKALRQGDAPIGQGKGLHALDGAGQAAFILRRLDQLDKVHRAALVARFSARVEACPCCGHDAPLPEYKESILLLAHWVQQYLPRKDTPERMRYAIVQEYFERSRSIRKIAESIGMPARTALDYKDRIWPQLSQLDKIAHGNIEQLLSGMCGEATA